MAPSARVTPHGVGRCRASDRGARARRAPPAGGEGENCASARNISGYDKVLSLRPFEAPLPLWRKRHLSRIGGVCLAEGDFFDTLSVRYNLCF